jgi:hypothetical protein
VSVQLLGEGGSARDHPFIMSEVSDDRISVHGGGERREERVGRQIGWGSKMERSQSLAGLPHWASRTAARPHSLLPPPLHPANTAGTASALHLHHPSPPYADRR